jgi:serine/threonine protein kinase
MNAQPTAHPSVEVLRAFLQNQTSFVPTEVVAAHLAVCPDCRRILAGLSASPSALPVTAPFDSAGVPFPLPDVPPELVGHPEYEVLRKLGEGGMGAVYLARNKLMDRLEVLKVVNQALLGRAGAAERFLQEIRAAAKLQHPNVVTAYAAVRLGGLLVLAMEYVDGLDLAALVQRQGPLPVPHACHFSRQVALGLQHAFERGMVHRDIKPQNLILGRKNEVKILDFGLAKVVREEEKGAGLTGANVMMGTPAYVAPEQAADARHADIRADVYSLGCTLYYLLTGRPPFVEERPMEVVLAHIQKEPEPLARLRPEVPAALAAVVARMLAKDPADRHPTPADVARALAPFVTGAGQSVTRPVPPTGPPGEKTLPHVAGAKTKRSARAWLGRAAAGCGVLTAVCLFWAWFARTPPEGTEPLSPGPAPAAPVAGFVPLFNGKDLTGWRPLPVGPAVWDVRDGVLTGRGGTGHLFYAAKQFDNFHLRVVTWINDGGNSGVYFRTPFGPTSPQGYPVGGYEAQINNTHGHPSKTGSLIVPAGLGVSLASSPVGSFEWFTLEVVAEGPHLIVKVNGLVTADYVDAAPGPLVGQVALQVLNAATEVRFRSVEIKELPARPAPALGPRGADERAPQG